MDLQRAHGRTLDEACEPANRGSAEGRMGFARRAVTRALSRAGVSIGGSDPWDITVHDERFYGRVLAHGSLGLGESYVEGLWDCVRVDELVARLLASDAEDRLFDWRSLLAALRARLVNRQTAARAGRVARAHYDLGDELFEKMLGPTMTYSCAYWRDATDLDAAQTAKMELVCQKLQLGPGQRLLDIGCGWGSLLRYAADRHGCEGVGITVSAPQREYAAARAGGRSLRFLVADYRSDEVARLGRFDKIASVGMFEHVGPMNHQAFMGVARRLLADGGLFLLHTIGNDRSPSDPWFERYIFPDSALPSMEQIARAVRGLFVMEDWHNLRADYVRTLLAWHARFERHAGELGVPEPFRRMWRFYLLAAAGSFRAGSRNQLWQIVLSKRGVEGGYRSPR